MAILKVFSTNLACNVDYIAKPSGYDPKHKLYVTSFFNVNSKDHYYWEFGTEFQTGEGILIAITIDGVVSSGNYDIVSIGSIRTALQELSGVSIDTFTVIENDTVIYVVSSSGQVYGNVTIGTPLAILYVAHTDDKYNYINNEYDIELGRNETFAYNMMGKFFNGFYAYTPEFYGYVDGQQFGLCNVSFKKGVPYFHNQENVSTYNIFYDTPTDQVISVVVNKSPETEKVFKAIAYDSKNKYSMLEGTKYEAVRIKTSDYMESTIPIEAFEFRENIYYSVFFRNTSYGGTLDSGQVLRGTWIEVTLVRDIEKREQYSELAKVVIFMETSAKAIT